jgi:hypothetical protein
LDLLRRALLQEFNNPIVTFVTCLHNLS